MRPRYARWRLGQQAEQVQRLTADVLDLAAAAATAGLDDRAVFHFLTGSRPAAVPAHTLESATAAGMAAVSGCFAPDGSVALRGPGIRAAAVRRPR